MTCLEINNKDEFEDDNNKHNVLIDISNNQHKELSSEEGKDKDEEFCTMVNDVTSSDVTSNHEKHKRKVMKSNVDESEHKEACTIAECERELKTKVKQ